MNNEYFIDDISVPDETRIYYSLFKASFYAFVCFLFTVGGIIMAVTSEKDRKWGIFISILFSYATYKFSKDVNNKKPQIIINQHGIKLNDNNYYKWSKISNEKVTYGISNEISVKLLVFNYKNERIKFEIDDFKIKESRLEYLLKIYRSRSKNIK